LRSYKLEGQGILNRPPSGIGKEPCGVISIVDNFVAARAPDFNKIQQTSMGRPQTLQHQSLKINRNSYIPIRLEIWFGTRRSVVQIHSPRPFLSTTSLSLLTAPLYPCGRFCSWSDPQHSTRGGRTRRYDTVVPTHVNCRLCIFSYRSPARTERRLPPRSISRYGLNVSARAASRRRRKSMAPVFVAGA
jgi:hypothetical protein